LKNVIHSKNCSVFGDYIFIVFKIVDKMPFCEKAASDRGQHHHFIQIDSIWVAVEGEESFGTESRERKKKRGRRSTSFLIILEEKFLKKRILEGNEEDG